MIEKSNTKSMNESVKELVAIGASVAAHCGPCLAYHLEAALKLGVASEDIEQAIAIGHKVEKGAMAAMKKVSNAAVQQLEKPVQSSPGSEMQRQAEKYVLKIYDPALCCSSGVCGPSVDPVLAQFAGTLKLISSRPGIVVERYNLSQQPQAFVENAQVKELLGGGGEKRLPFVFLNDQLWLQERYPSRDELLKALGLESGAVSLPIASISEDGPCCDEGGCC